MNECIELIDRNTYKYRGTYSLPHTHFDIIDEYVYFINRTGVAQSSNESNVCAEIGILDLEDLSLYPCKVKIGRIYVVKAEAVPNNNRYKTGSVDDTVYVFFCYLFNKSFSEKREFEFKGTVHEFAGCCQILNYYVENNFEIDLCQVDRIQNKSRRYWDRSGTQPYKVLEIADNIQFTDFVKFLYSAENRAYASCKYSFRHGEYAHDYWETLTFRTDNPAFIEIVQKVLNREIIKQDNYYSVEYEFSEDTVYNGGLSVMVEKEGTEVVNPKGAFKKETIKKVINESCRTFPSELYIICKRVSSDV